jgi:colicin import membrane protein
VRQYVTAEYETVE